MEDEGKAFGEEMFQKGGSEEEVGEEQRHRQSILDRVEDALHGSEGG